MVLQQLQTATTELQSVESTLDAVLLNGSPNVTSLAALINAAIPSISTTPFSATTLNSLTAAQVPTSYSPTLYVPVPANDLSMSARQL